MTSEEIYRKIETEGPKSKINKNGLGRVISRAFGKNLKTGRTRSLKYVRFLKLLLLVW